jgi:hypothetical protein
MNWEFGGQSWVLLPAEGIFSWISQMVENPLIKQGEAANPPISWTWYP